MNVIFAVIALVLAAGTWIGLHVWLDPKSNSFKEIAINVFSFISIFIYAAILAFIPISYIYSDGTKIGTLAKITTKGVIFKTHEGQLNLGGAVGDGQGGMVANTFSFTVLDEQLFKKLQSIENSRVALQYEEWLRVPKNMGETNYIVTDVKIIK